MSARQFIDSASFGPEALKAIGDAFAGAYPVSLATVPWCSASDRALAAWWWVNLEAWS
jgi:hypothetical protein